MQLKLSLAAATILLSTAVQAEDYISIQYMGYDEESGRTYIHSPAIELSKDFGADYTLKISYTHDSLSGASPTWYDAASGASASLTGGVTTPSNVTYGNLPYSDERNATSLSLVTRFESRDELTLGVNHSVEHDFTSNEASVGYLHYLDESKNRSVTLGVSYQDNTVKIPCYLGNHVCDGISGASGKSVEKGIKVVSAEAGYTQILDTTSLIKGSLFVTRETGYLSNPYMRVVRDYHTAPRITEEHKPDSRLSYGIMVEYDKAFNDQWTGIFSYRLYHDSWEITSHTVNMQLYYAATEKLTLGLNLRAYLQSSAYFYSHEKDHFTDERTASSDRRMGDYASYNTAVSLRYKLTEDLTLNGAVGYYDQPGLYDARYVNVGLKYAF